MVSKAIATLLLSAMIAASNVPAVGEEPAMEYVGEYRVTAFNYYEGNGENYHTASGATPTPYYTVATNDEFPFGTVLYIDGIGEVEVQDRGAFPDGVIDLHIGDTPMSEFDDRVRAVYIVRR